MENAKKIIESTAKAAKEKLKEMNAAEISKEIVSKTTPLVSNLFDWSLKTSKEIVVKTMPFVRTSSNWLLEKAPPLTSTATNQIQKAPPLISTATNQIQKAPPLISTATNHIQKVPLYYTIPIGFLLILLLQRCCGGGTGKTMKAPGRKNVSMARRDFESSPKSYFRKLCSKNSSNWLHEIAPPLISTATNQIEKAKLFDTIPIGFLLIWLLRRCCGGGGTGKMMKAPGRKNVWMPRCDFESSPESYFRKLRSEKK